jgi:serine/threonine protein kinase
MPKYTRISKLSSGAYGTITEAKHAANRYAIKRNIVNCSLDFCGSLKELDILQETCKHPHIVGLEEKTFAQPFTSSEDRTPDMRKKALKYDNVFFVMPLAKGDCRHAIYQNSLNIEHIRWCACNILLGVEYLHSRGIIHRDIKPGNILWFDADDKSLFGTLALCDFGMAKRHTQQHKNSPRVITCWYRAPEVCKGDDYDFKVDCWSTGCVLYEMLTRNVLVRAKDDEQILATIKAKVPSTWQQWKQHLQDCEMLEVLSGLLQQDPSSRYSATQALDTSFFDNHRDYISSVRRQFCVQAAVEHCHNPGQKIDSYVFALALDVFNKRQQRPEYSHRALFFAIDLMARYFALIGADSERSQRGTRLRFFVCLYIGVKYFSRGRCRYSFSDIAKDERVTRTTRDFAQKFETFLVENVPKSLYRQNVFERQSKPLCDKDVEELLRSLAPQA